VNVILSGSVVNSPRRFSSCFSYCNRVIVFISRMPRVLDRPDRILIISVTYKRSICNLTLPPPDSARIRHEGHVLLLLPFGLTCFRSKTYLLVRRRHSLLAITHLSIVKKGRCGLVRTPCSFFSSSIILSREKFSFPLFLICRPLNRREYASSLLWARKITPRECTRDALIRHTRARKQEELLTR